MELLAHGPWRCTELPCKSGLLLSHGLTLGKDLVLLLLLLLCPHLKKHSLAFLGSQILETLHVVPALQIQSLQSLLKAQGIEVRGAIVEAEVVSESAELHVSAAVTLRSEAVLLRLQIAAPVRQQPVRTLIRVRSYGLIRSQAQLTKELISVRLRDPQRLVGVRHPLIQVL